MSKADREVDKPYDFSSEMISHTTEMISILTYSQLRLFITENLLLHYDWGTDTTKFLWEQDQTGIFYRRVCKDKS